MMSLNQTEGCLICTKTLLGSLQTLWIPVVQVVTFLKPYLSMEWDQNMKLLLEMVMKVTFFLKVKNTAVIDYLKSTIEVLAL